MNEANKAISTAEREANLLALKSALTYEPKIADLIAEQRKIHYDASIRKGFTKQEALVLCMKPTFK